MWAGVQVIARNDLRKGGVLYTLSSVDDCCERQARCAVNGHNVDDDHDDDF